MAFFSLASHTYPATSAEYLESANPSTHRVNIGYIINGWSSMLSGPSVSVYVGAADRTLFSVPKALLCHHSAYFQGAFSGHFVESVNNEITLSDESPEVFKYVVFWMHRGLVPVMQRNIPITKATCFLLCRIYYLADMLQIQGLMHAVLAELREMWDHQKSQPIDMELVMDVWARTSEASMLRTEICRGLAAWLKERRDHGIREFEPCFTQIPGFGVLLMEQFRALAVVQIFVPDVD
ncbi:MAG: hypothetical protein Q9191_001749 [Dirinaria sp. TL-2023a]